MNWLDLAAVPLLARICLVVLFPVSALDKIVHWNAAVKQAESSFVPGGAALVVLAIAIELAAPLAILVGWHDRLAAFVLAGFCAVTAVLYHPFWTCADFWTPQDTAGRRHFWDFLKNFGLAGGLLLLVIGGGFAPVSAVIEEPLSSTPRAAPPVPARGAAAALHPAGPVPSSPTRIPS